METKIIKVVKKEEFKTKGEKDALKITDENGKQYYIFFADRNRIINVDASLKLTGEQKGDFWNVKTAEKATTEEVKSVITERQEEAIMKQTSIERLNNLTNIANIWIAGKYPDDDIRVIAMHRIFAATVIPWASQLPKAENEPEPTDILAKVGNDKTPKAGKPTVVSTEDKTENPEDQAFLNVYNKIDETENSEAKASLNPVVAEAIKLGAKVVNPRAPFKNAGELLMYYFKAPYKLKRDTILGILNVAKPTDIKDLEVAAKEIEAIVNLKP